MLLWQKCLLESIGTSREKTFYRKSFLQRIYFFLQKKCLWEKLFFYRKILLQTYRKRLLWNKVLFYGKKCLQEKILFYRKYVFQRIALPIENSLSEKKVCEESVFHKQLFFSKQIMSSRKNSSWKKMSFKYYFLW